MGVLAIESVTVDERKLEAVVRVIDTALTRTSAVPGVATRAVALLPGLARHTCENSDGRYALREFANTETPHLLEHLTCELMALAGSPRTLRGATSWDFSRDGEGVFRVCLEYDDDLVALGALREGCAIVEWLLRGAGGGEAPDVDAAVGRLRAARGGAASGGGGIGGHS